MTDNLVLYTRAVPAHDGGTIYRYFAKLQSLSQTGKPQEITKKCLDLATEMLERHVTLGSTKRERAWSVVMSAMKDALYPDKKEGCSVADQESAFAWLRTDEASDLMEMVGVEQEYATWVIRKLTSDACEENKDEQNTCSADSRVA